MQTTYNNQVAKTGDNPQFDNETPLLKNPGHAPDRLSHSCQQVTIMPHKMSGKILSQSYKNLGKLTGRMSKNQCHLKSCYFCHH